MGICSVCGLSTFVFRESPFLNFSFPLVSHLYPMTACMLGKNSLPELHQPLGASFKLQLPFLGTFVKRIFCH